MWPVAKSAVSVCVCVSMCVCECVKGRASCSDTVTLCTAEHAPAFVCGCPVITKKDTEHVQFVCVYVVYVVDVRFSVRNILCLKCAGESHRHNVKHKCTHRNIGMIFHIIYKQGICAKCDINVLYRTRLRSF